MRMEVHVHADIPILEGISKKRIEEALAPWLEYLDAEGMADVKSLEPDEPGIKFDDKDLLLLLCWTGEIGRSFHAALDQALETLSALDARQCRVVELRFFAGLNIDETADALEISPATVARDWALAKVWLYRRLSPDP